MKKNRHRLAFDFKTASMSSQPIFDSYINRAGWSRRSLQKDAEAAWQGFEEEERADQDVCA